MDPAPARTPAAPIKIGARFFASDDAYLMVGKGYAGMAALPQVLLEAGRLAAALGRVLLEPCLSYGEIVPCSCAPGVVRTAVPTAAPVGWEAALAALTSGGAVPESVCSAAAPTDESALFGRLSPAREKGESYPAGAFVDWTAVGPATGARTITWAAVCAAGVLTADAAASAGDPNAKVFSLPIAYCGVGDKEECGKGLDGVAARQMWVTEWKGLLLTGLSALNVVQRLRTEDSQVLALFEYVPGSLRLPAMGGGVAVDVLPGGEKGAARAASAVAAAAAIPWSSYQVWTAAKLGGEWGGAGRRSGSAECVSSLAVQWIMYDAPPTRPLSQCTATLPLSQSPFRAVGGEYLALHWQTMRTPRDYYPACQERMSNTVKGQFRRFVDAESPRALVLSDAPAVENPFQVGGRRCCMFLLLLGGTVQDGVEEGNLVWSTG